MPSFYVGGGVDLDSDLYAYEPYTVPTESSPCPPRDICVLALDSVLQNIDYLCLHGSSTSSSSVFTYELDYLLCLLLL